MNLIDAWKEECTLIERRHVSDGEGGLIVTWEEGATFLAAITFNSSMEARRAEKEGVSSLYTVTTEKNVALQYHDVFRRLSDGKIFRVTSDGKDVQTPETATFSFGQVTAEKWELTQ